jgi:4,5-DOPA dioxygenase extradiol
MTISSERVMPAAFFGHGSPMNALAANRFTRAWRDFPGSLPRPRAILVISAHWYIERTALTAMPNPPTIHDFGGFPKALFDARYDAPGDPALAAQIAAMLDLNATALDQRWGLDHGAWSVLVHLYPEADIPVLQLAIDATKPAAYHWELGTRLGALRDAGILVLGSGNIVHNLARVSFRDEAPPEWSVRFDAYIERALAREDRDALVGYEQHPDARLAAPDPDHFLPLLYIAALRRPSDRLTTIVDGFDLGSISMRSISIG